MNFYRNSKCDTWDGFNHFPQFIEIIKNNLLICKALRVGIGITQGYLLSLFIYPLLKPPKGLGNSWQKQYCEWPVYWQGGQ